MMNYNLLDEKWIPVLYHNGQWERVGIRKALEQADRIREIAACNPMDRVALFRFLLALLYWCQGSPPDDGNGALNGSILKDCLPKLDEHRDCFNLLGDGKRFYQDANAQRSRAITDLIHEIPTGNNFWHFRHSTDGESGICPACCAMGLLRLPLFSVSGLPDLKAGINGTPPIYVIPLGLSLLESLNMNWITCESPGTPAWVQPDISPSADDEVPLLTGLTLLSRKVWLHDPVESADACICCGVRDSPLIVSCEYQSAGNQKSELWNDPHVIYNLTLPRKASIASDLTAAGKFRMDRPWTYLMNQMMESDPSRFTGKPVTLFIVGFATDKAKYVDVWDRKMTLSLTGEITDSASGLPLNWQREGNGLEKRIGRSKVQNASLIASIRPHVETQVSARVGQLLGGTDEDWQKAAEEYHPMMRAVARSLYPGVTANALEQRRRISQIKPDMKNSPERLKKVAKQKGGNT